VQIEPNYRLSAQDIFTDFAKACITSTKRLEILRQAGNNENVKPKVKDYIDQTSLFSGQGKICPTWVPGLRRELSNAGLKADIPYSASSDTVAEVQFGDLNYLAARGFRVDIIDGLGSCMKHDISRRDMDVLKRTGLMEPSVEGQPVVQPTQKLQQTPYHDEEGLRDALLKTMVAGRDNFPTDYFPKSVQSLLDLPIFLEPEALHRSLGNGSFYRTLVMICHFTQHFKIGGRPFINYFPKSVHPMDFQLPPPTRVAC